MADRRKRIHGESSDDNEFVPFKKMYPNQGQISMPKEMSFGEEQGMIPFSMSGYMNGMNPMTMCPPGYFPFIPQPQPGAPPMPPPPFDFSNMTSGFELGEYAKYEKEYKESMDNEYSARIPDKVRRNEKFGEVSGRLCMLSGTKKYPVTVGEICRRMSPPETLHTSLINGILRNAKAKDNGAKLRQHLLNYSIELPQGRRKTCRTTGFTALCEGEAKQLADDYHQVCLEKGGYDEIGKQFASQLSKEVSSYTEQIKEIDAIQRFLNFLTAIHKPEVSPDDLEYQNPAEKSVQTLSLFTHGFSHVANAGVAKYFKFIADSSKAHLLRIMDQHQTLTSMVVPPSFSFRPTDEES